MNKDDGFTLIELMAVVSILSILAVIALGAYADYVVRSKVSEGLAFAAEAKTSVSEFYSGQRAMPANNGQAGLPTVAQYELASHNFIHFVQITGTPKPGTISIKLKIPGTKADNKFLQLVPSTADGHVSWTCIPATDEGVDLSQVPPNCRG